MSSRETPCCSRRWAAWESGSLKMATRTCGPRTSSLPALPICNAASWIALWKASVGLTSPVAAEGRLGISRSRNFSSAFLSLSTSAPAWRSVSLVSSSWIRA
jgi:hypothetical protein